MHKSGAKLNKMLVFTNITNEVSQIFVL